MKPILVIALSAMVLGGAQLVSEPRASAQSPLRVVCSNVIKGAADRLFPEYERQTGRHLAVEYGASGELKREIDAGRPFDVALLTTTVMDALVREGKVVQASRTTLAQANLAVAVRSGDAKGDVASVDGMKRRLLAAKSITYSKDGGGVPAIERMLTELGIAGDAGPKIVLQSVAGRAAEAVALGEEELAFAPLTEIVAVPGVAVAGLFPREFQSPLTIDVGTMASAASPAEAADLIQFLRMPTSLDAMTASGMQVLVAK
jgi:molybdate transport system substrate-binding protein